MTKKELHMFADYEGVSVTSLVKDLGWAYSTVVQHKGQDIPTKLGHIAKLASFMSLQGYNWREIMKNKLGVLDWRISESDKFSYSLEPK